MRLPRLRKRVIMLVLFVTLFDLSLFGFVCFLFLLVSGKCCGMWLSHSLDFSLTFFAGCTGNRLENAVHRLKWDVSQRTTKPTMRHVRPAKPQIRLRFRAVWSEFLLIACAFYSPPANQRGVNENPWHTGWMYRLTWVFADRKSLIVGFFRALAHMFVTVYHDTTYK